jgi:hypothetical protein
MTKYRLEDHALETMLIGSWEEVSGYVRSMVDQNQEWGDQTRTVSLADYECSLFNHDTGKYIKNAQIEIIMHEPDVFLKIEG